MAGGRTEGREDYRDNEEGDDRDYEGQGDSGLQDETIDCRDCGAQFLFSVAEQEFYKEKGFENKPARCKACKDAKKARMDGGSRGGGYGDRDRERYSDRRDDRGGGGGGYERRSGGGGGGACYAFQRGECDRGSSCRFSHEGGDGGGGGGRGDRSGGGGRGYSDRGASNYGGRGGGGGDRSSGGGGGGRGVCYAFQKGQCDRGSSCRFSHE